MENEMKTLIILGFLQAFMGSKTCARRFSRLADTRCCTDPTHNGFLLLTLGHCFCARRPIGAVSFQV